MKLYEQMLNINGLNIEEELTKSIATVKNELSGLTEERMCKVYSSYLYNNLLKKHIPAKLLSTLSFGFDYEHIFILIPDNSEYYFLVDLTFSQFGIEDNTFKHLSKHNYQKIKKDGLELYFDVIFNKIKKIPKAQKII